MDQSNSECNIQALPPELMVKIFEFFTVRELLSVSLTCKTWRQVAFSPKFSTKICVRVGNRMIGFGDVDAYRKYRHARAMKEKPGRDNQSAILTDFFRAAPLESLVACGTVEGVVDILKDRLPLMNQLSALVLSVDGDFYNGNDVLTISHPGLKSVEPNGSIKNITFENCPNLINLCIHAATESKKAVQLVIQLQQQLQCLEMVIRGDQYLKMLTNAGLSNLKQLKLYICQGISYVHGTKLSFDTMDNLVELCLQTQGLGSYSHRHMTVGEELGVLTKLSKLKLIYVTIDAEGFANALLQMKELKDLKLDRCAFISSTQSYYIASEAVRNLNFTILRLKDERQVMFPHCTSIKRLKLSTDDKRIDDIFVQACNLYPQLEKLYLGSKFGCAKFNSSATFSHIQKLKFLKDLHLFKLCLENVDWTACSCLEITTLQLTKCAIDANGMRQLIKSVGTRLQYLFLNECNQQYVYHYSNCSKFIITEKFVQSLREELRNCRISFKY